VLLAGLVGLSAGLDIGATSLSSPSRSASASSSRSLFVRIAFMHVVYFGLVLPVHSINLSGGMQASVTYTIQDICETEPNTLKDTLEQDK
jgi:hypothetical protein